MLSKLWVNGFRNLKETVLAFGPSLNHVLIGKNAQGKTSILEALYMGIYYKSPISDVSQHAICHEREAFQLGLELKNLSVTHKITMSLTQEGQRHVFLNQEPSLSNHLMTSTYWVEFMGADDWRLLNESPAFRRENID